MRLVGFRVIDLSFKGFSIFANREERDYFEAIKNVGFYLLGEDSVVKINKAFVVHSLHYLNSSLGKLDVYKVGFRFIPDFDYEEFWRALSHKYQLQLQHEIEDFSRS